MPDYRRLFIPGGTYFFTVVTYNRRLIFQDPTAIKIFEDAWKFVSSKHPFTTVAFCLLPDHFHCVMALPKNDSDFPIRIREIKRLFTFNFPGQRNENLSASRQKRSEAGIWQRRYWEHAIRDEKDLEHHIQYIHFNPVKHGYVKNAYDWKWSSFQRYVQKGLYEEGWGESIEEIFNLKYGE